MDGWMDGMKWDEEVTRTKGIDKMSEPRGGFESGTFERWVERLEGGCFGVRGDW